MKYMFLVPVWGAEYSRLFVETALPMMMTPGNLGHFAGRKDCMVTIMTTRRDYAQMEQSQALKDLKSSMPVEPVFLDGVVDISNTHIAMSEAYMMGMTHSAVVPGVTSYVFLTPDSFWSDGSFRRVDEVMQSGKKVVAVLGLRVDKEAMEPFVQQHFTEAGSYTPIATPRLVTHVLTNLHGIGRAVNWLSNQFSNRWPSQIYWLRDNNLMYAHCFHLHPLAVTSPPRLRRFKSTIDGDYLMKINTDFSDYYVVTSSDDIFGIEMSPRDRTISEALTAPSITAVRRFALLYTNRFHKHFFNFRIVFMGDHHTERDKVLESQIDTIVEDINRSSKIRNLILPLVSRWGPPAIALKVRVDNAVRMTVKSALRMVLGGRGEQAIAWITNLEKRVRSSFKR